MTLRTPEEIAVDVLRCGWDGAEAIQNGAASGSQAAPCGAGGARGVARNAARRGSRAAAGDDAREHAEAGEGGTSEKRRRRRKPQKRKRATQSLSDAIFNVEPIEAPFASVKDGVYRDTDGARKDRP